ncbi:hypothetical protein ACVBEG_27675 [Pseudomonas sp. GG8]
MDQFIQRGGVIDVIPTGETADTILASEIPPRLDIQILSKIPHKTGTIEKFGGQGCRALTLSNTPEAMNKKDVRRMAGEHGLKISYSRPIRGIQNEKG